MGKELLTSRSEKPAGGSEGNEKSLSGYKCRSLVPAAKSVGIPQVLLSIGSYLGLDELLVAQRCHQRRKVLEYPHAGLFTQDRYLKRPLPGDLGDSVS